MSQYAVAGGQTAPAVVTWFKIYAAFMALLYFAVAAASLFFFFGVVDEKDPGANMIAGVVLLGVGGVLFVAYVIPFFLRPRPGVWIYDIVLIAIGLTSCLTIPACIPLLIFWVRPETQRYFGRL